MISVLFCSRKISKSDVEVAMGEIVEFIDSFIVDSPKAMNYVADMLAEFILINALNIPWLCDQLIKLQEFSAHLIPQLVACTIDSMIRMQGPENTRNIFTPHGARLSSTLGSAWNQIAGSKFN